ncbi:hypothetical protein F2Q69_00048006 [Brassica cretica]|uniref:DUF4005 domain-containing protein n=1 Tax=Brassica cretica TaxID=69181 RepID=A0A8S9PZI6_BRACR|nr:hypothetical protein F2Q69_00048006 [Brassica cretica]
MKDLSSIFLLVVAEASPFDVPQSMDQYMEPAPHRDQDVLNNSTEVHPPNCTDQTDRAVYWIDLRSSEMEFRLEPRSDDRTDRTRARLSRPSRHSKDNSRARLSLGREEPEDRRGFSPGGPSFHSISVPEVDRALARARSLRSDRALARARSLRSDRALARARSLRSDRALARARSLRSDRALARARSLRSDRALTQARSLRSDRALARTWLLRSDRTACMRGNYTTVKLVPEVSFAFSDHIQHPAKVILQSRTYHPSFSVTMRCGFESMPRRPSWRFSAVRSFHGSLVDVSRTASRSIGT